MCWKRRCTDALGVSGAPTCCRTEGEQALPLTAIGAAKSTGTRCPRRLIMVGDFEEKKRGKGNVEAKRETEKSQSILNALPFSDLALGGLVETEKDRSRRIVALKTAFNDHKSRTNLQCPLLLGKQVAQSFQRQLDQFRSVIGAHTIGSPRPR